MNNHTLIEFKNKKLFGGLDGLRFISIIAVVWHHSVVDIEWFKIGSAGFLGVDLFFVISGFLIVTLLLRERDKTGTISLKNFYIRRSLRIFPIYYGLILGLAFIYYFFKTDSAFGQQLISELPIYLLYLANFFPVIFGIVWSLASEEQFYLLWPFLEKHFSKFIMLLLFIAILINQVINFYRVPLFDSLGVPHLSELNIMQATFTPILLGVLIAHWLHQETHTKWLLPLIDKKYSSSLWFLVLLGIITFSPSDIAGLPRLTIQIAMCLLVASTVLTENHYLNYLLKFKPFARVGAISYGIYLFHIHCIGFTKAVLSKIHIDNQFLIFLASMLVTVIVAEISFRLFEMPFLKLKSKFSAVHQKHT